MTTPENFPWDDCKIAFNIDDPDTVWQLFNGTPCLLLPMGWELVETDSSGARAVAIFRVMGLPTVTDGEKVKAILRNTGAIT